METLGQCGRSGRQYDLDDRNPSVLAGRRASEYEPKVFPEDRCEKCEAEGRHESETCFHRHWQTKQEGQEAE